jgi:hypothetical protein
MLSLLRGAIGLIVWLLQVSAAHAEKRIALLIGYQTKCVGWGTQEPTQ